MDNNFSKNFIVNIEHTAKNIGSGNLDVLSTPMLIAYIEETCRDYLNINYINNSEYSSVGSEIKVRHKAPSKVGASILIKIVLENIIKEKIFDFFITAFDESTNKEIATATHTRIIVNINKFLSNTK